MPVREVRQLGTAGVRTRTSIDITSMKRDRALHGLSSSGSLELATGALSSLPLKRIKISFPASLFPYLSVSLSLCLSVSLSLSLSLPLSLSLSGLLIFSRANSTEQSRARGNNETYDPLSLRNTQSRGRRYSSAYGNDNFGICATHNPNEIFFAET